MKKTLTLFVTLLLVLTVAVGCSQKGKDAQTTTKEQTEATTNVGKDNNSSAENEKSANKYGVPMETDEYYFKDLEDPNNSYTLETMDESFGIEGYRIIGDGEEGSNILIYAEAGKALTVKSINYIGDTYAIVLQKVEKGTPMSNDKLAIIASKPFKTQQIQYEDGTKLRDINIFADEVGLFKNKGLFQEVKGNEVLIIPEGSTLEYTYTLDGITADAFKDFKKGDEIEFMNGTAKDTVHSVRLAQAQ